MHNLVFTKSNLSLLSCQSSSVDFKPDGENEDTTAHIAAELNGIAKIGSETPSVLPAKDDSTKTTTPTTGQIPDVTEQKPRPGPVAVFKQVSGGARCMAFSGWHKIQKVAFLERQSPELYPHARAEMDED
jgi:hypothetical protein